MLEQCTWPDLDPVHDRALKAAVSWLFTQVQPLGVIATGTIVRGEHHPSSDLDLYVLHAAPFRRRVQRFFEGVPVEIFINPVETVRRYMEEEQQSGRRVTAHMLATGVVVLDRHPLVELLRDEARAWLDLPDGVGHVDAARYAPATQLEDASDVVAHDPVTAGFMAHRAVWSMLEFAFRRSGRAIPRPKSMIADLSALDAELAELVRQFGSAPSAARQVELAQHIADRTIEARGFFEWDSGAEPAPAVFENGAWPDDSPEATILRFLAATREERWDDAVDLIETRAGYEYASSRRRYFLDRQPHPPTEADFATIYPDASPEVLAWHVESARRARERPPSECEQAFAGVRSDDELCALDVRGVLRSLVEAADIRYQYKLAYAAEGRPLPRAAESPPGGGRQVTLLGHLSETPDRALVLYRENDGPGAPTRVVELTRSTGGAWHLPPRHALTTESPSGVFILDPD